MKTTRGHGARRSWVAMIGLLGMMLACSAIAGRVAADTLPKGTAKDDSASKGKTDVTEDGFAGAAKKPVDKDEKDKDATELRITAGGLATSGNSRVLALTTKIDTRIRRDESMFTGVFAGNYSRAALAGQPVQTTSENLQLKGRYDYFFAPHWSFFLGLQGRRDRFAGLDLRTQIDPGVAYYAIDDEKVRLWLEAGYDLLHDIRRDEDRGVLDDKKHPVLDASGNQVLLDKTITVHGARSFLGYENKLNEGVSILAGLEYLQGLSNTVLWRINADFALQSKLGKSFALATSFSLRYDHSPLPGKEKIDTSTALSLVYTAL